jgi:hypothetical protein
MADAKHRQDIADLHERLLRQDAETTEAVRKLTAEIHGTICETA